MRKMSDSPKTKKPWPTKAAMNQVYEKNLWGGIENEFYSGDGSHNLDIVNPYKEAVILFLKSFQTPLQVCDLGCGDFNVGKDFVTYTSNYIALDIVENLIKHNKEKFKNKYLEFQCLDIAVDDLPLGDCVILRQVLQHLSNKEVKSVLEKLTQYKYVILTEHVPVGVFIPNKDIISGQGIRLKKKSGLDILKSPFNFIVKEQKELSSVVLENNKGVIITTLFTLF